MFNYHLLHCYRKVSNYTISLFVLGCLTREAELEKRYHLVLSVTGRGWFLEEEEEKKENLRGSSLSVEGKRLKPQGKSSHRFEILDLFPDKQGGVLNKRSWKALAGIGSKIKWVVRRRIKRE